MPANRYSMGSSMVVTFFPGEFKYFNMEKSVVVFPDPVGPVTKNIP